MLRLSGGTFSSRAWRRRQRRRHRHRAPACGYVRAQLLHILHLLHQQRLFTHAELLLLNPALRLRLQMARQHQGLLHGRL